MHYAEEHPGRHPDGVPDRGVFHLKLVVQLQRKLNLPRIVRIVAGRSDFAEVRVGLVARTTDRDYAIAAHVELQKGERSELAELAANIL